MSTPGSDVELAAARTAVGTGARDLLLRFVDELRVVGVPVSIAEALDALRALEHVPLGQREVFKAALGATLVKNHAHWTAFETAFEVFFALAPSQPISGDDEDGPADALDEFFPGMGMGNQQGAGGGGDVDTEDLVQALFEALRGGDDTGLRALARLAVNRHAGMEPGRPVGGTYYLYRTLRAVALDALLERVLREERQRREQAAEDPLTPLEERLLRDEIAAHVEAFREEVKSEIRRRLVDDRGIEAMAKTLRKPLLEEVDFMQATSEEMKRMRRAIQPLARRLAAKLARRRRHLRRGRLDVRRTMRESLSSGGVPLDPQFRHPRPHKPEVFLICDISGSVSSFARFTMQLVYAMQAQFSKVRSFVFIDDLDEVTDFFATDDLAQALARVNTEAKVVWIDGHSDYGHALATFDARYSDSVNGKSAVILTGDARNNYHQSNAAVLEELKKRARHVYWLNPEPASYWDTGDSVISEYAIHCDGVYEVRNLRQLERFVEELVQ